MTVFTRAWNAPYEALPANSDDARGGASSLRQLKVDIRERMDVDHNWNGTPQDGAHKALTMLVQSTDPTPQAGAGRLYVKRQGTLIQLYYRDDAGQIFPMTSTSGGQANIVQPGTVILVANTSDADGITYVQCDGRAVDRTTYAILYSVIGTLWGAGDGSTTFNVPDLRGRAPIGRGTGAGLSARTTAQKMGAETHSLSIQEMPGHYHNIQSHTSDNVAGSGQAWLRAEGAEESYAQSYTSGGNAITGIAEPHNNMQPSVVVNFWIKT